MREPPATPSPDTEALHRDAEERVRELEDRLTEVERRIENHPPAGPSDGSRNDKPGRPDKG